MFSRLAASESHPIMTRNTDLGPARGAGPLPAWTGPLDDLGLYVHVPFCARECPYCDFVTSPLEPSLQRGYLDALGREVRSSPWAGSRVFTLFLGGGTPSVLDASDLGELLRRIGDRFDLSALDEASIECNPETLNEEKIDALKQLGFNRISLGVQSFQDRHLKRLGRLHDADQAREAMRLIRNSGLSRLNVDLIFAVPDQGQREFESDIAKVLDHDPGHVSLFHLTFEKETDFYARMHRGDLIPPGDRVAGELLRAAMHRMESAGYRQYEISSFARPGHECLHNQRYWQNLPTLGIGVGAASYIEGVRWANTRQLTTYLEAGSDLPALDFIEKLAPREALGEEIMLRLRTDEGVHLEQVSAKFGLDGPGLFGESVEHLMKLDLVSWRGPYLRLTHDGLMAADSISLEFL